MPSRPQVFAFQGVSAAGLWGIVLLPTLLFQPQAHAALSKHMDSLIMAASRDCLQVNGELLKQRYSHVQERKGEDGSVVRRYAVDQKTTIIFRETRVQINCMVLGEPYDDTVQESLRQRRAMRTYEDIKPILTREVISRYSIFQVIQPVHSGSPSATRKRKTLFQ